jgi:hypothetical protein
MSFTALEKAVLAKLIESARGNGHDFGFIEDARGVCPQVNQLSGVVASLVKKGVIIVHDFENGWTQFTWPGEYGRPIIPTLPDFETKAECEAEGVHHASHHRTVGEKSKIMSDEFYKQLPYVEIRKVPDADRETGVRVYCYTSGTAWNLQIRGPMTLANQSEGKDVVIATATLEPQDVRDLRAALGRMLGED